MPCDLKCWAILLSICLSLQSSIYQCNFTIITKRRPTEENQTVFGKYWIILIVKLLPTFSSFFIHFRIRIFKQLSLKNIFGLWYIQNVYQRFTLKFKWNERKFIIKYKTILKKEHVRKILTRKNEKNLIKTCSYGGSWMMMLYNKYSSIYLP